MYTPAPGWAGAGGEDEADAMREDSGRQQSNAPPQYSPDGQWWWNGQQWISVQEAPAQRQYPSPRPSIDAPIEGSPGVLPDPAPCPRTARSNSGSECDGSAGRWGPASWRATTAGKTRSKRSGGLGAGPGDCDRSGRDPRRGDLHAPGGPRVRGVRADVTAADCSGDPCDRVGNPFPATDRTIAWTPKGP